MVISTHANTAVSEEDLCGICQLHMYKLHATGTSVVALQHFLSSHPIIIVPFLDRAAAVGSGGIHPPPPL